jgi:MFS transporter, SP family, inositol transporter
MGAASQAEAVAIQALSFSIGMASIYFVFMRLSDKVNQRTLFLWSAIIQTIGMALLIVFPLTIPIALLYVFLLQFGGGFGAQSFFQLWSSEQFPTMLRSTAQGVCFAIVRIGLGIFSFFVPMLNAQGFDKLAMILTGFLIISGVIGYFWAPRNEGKSLEQLEAERG